MVRRHGEPASSERFPDVDQIVMPDFTNVPLRSAGRFMM